MANEPIAFDRSLDACGVTCPLPLLKTKKALAQMNPGEVLRVLATDPGAAHDFEAFARQTGHTLLAQQRADAATWVFYLKCR
jgi:tRNA 2-thiouridine synthesizing protein A